MSSIALSFNNVDLVSIDGGEVNSNVYILVFKKGFLKIGKADDVVKRMVALELAWGDVDCKESFFLKVGRDDVYKVESMLHHLMAANSFDAGLGDGYTELFDIQSLPVILEYLNIYIKNNNQPIRLIKGIDKPKKISTKKNPVVRKTKIEKRQLVESERVKSIAQAQMITSVLSKYVAFLHKHKGTDCKIIKKGKEYYQLELFDARLANVVRNSRLAGRFLSRGNISEKNHNLCFITGVAATDCGLISIDISTHANSDLTKHPITGSVRDSVMEMISTLEVGRR